MLGVGYQKIIKMKKIFAAFILFFILFPYLYSQNNYLKFALEKLEEREELYFKFELDNLYLLHELGKTISIDGVQNNTVYAYATMPQFESFLEYNLDFIPVYDYYLQTKAFTMANTVQEMENWVRYPTYAVYTQMMQDFQTNYPNLARLDTIGYSVNGYPIVCIAISSDINTPADKPKFWYSSTMHGDELVGYVLLLRLADYLLSNYGTDPQVTNLVNEIVIHIDPLANPDGTFWGSPNYDDVVNSRRNNANNYDLNRNFPRIDNVPTSIEPEIQIMMDYAEQIGFTMSANGHSGAELINYPWDFWNSSQNMTADDAWWQHVSWIYADNAHQNSPPGYFIGTGNGVTNGGDWYVITGSRQDYMNYFQYNREVTLEWTNVKKVDADQLNAYWDYNKQALLDYSEQVLYGFRGIITNACTGEPVVGAKVEIAGHDKDNSEVYSFAPVGNYHRLIYQGTYEVTFSAEGFQDFTATVNVQNNNSTRLDVELVPNGVGIPEFSASQNSIFTGESVTFSNLTSGPVSSYIWEFPGGDPDFSNEQDPGTITYNQEGYFDVILEIESLGCNLVLEKEEYIKVYPNLSPVADFTADFTEIPAGAIVSFTDLSINNPNQWEWTFYGGTPSTSSEQNPQIQYNTPGVYDVKLFISNQHGEDELIKTDYIIVELPDVCAAGGGNPEQLHIVNFTLNTINNDSGASSYSDFTDISTNLVLGETYEFSANASDIYEYNQVLIWVDWNGNGIFSEPNSLIYQSATEAEGFFAGNFTVPENAVTGPVRLRIRLHNNLAGYGPNSTPCGNSNYGEVEDYKLILEIPELPPVADFSSDAEESCTGIINFSCESFFAEYWLWDFGDGNTSEQKNPQHNYNESGIFSVSLTVFNLYGEDFISKTDFVNIILPDAPATIDAESCGEAELTLFAQGEGDINWYDVLSGGQIINSGTSYTDFFYSTRTFYVESVVASSETDYFGNTHSEINGGNHTNNNFYLIFDAYREFTLNSVEVNADSGGNRIIELRDNQNQIVESKTVFISAGLSRIELDFEIEQGTGYQLRCGTNNPSLWRNNEGVAYPYVLDDVAAITGSNAGEDFYYYFYDWEVSYVNYCISPRVPVTAHIHEIPLINIDEEIIHCGYSLVLDAGEGYTAYYWNGTQGAQTFEVTESGIYVIEVEDENSCYAEVEIEVFLFPPFDIYIEFNPPSSLVSNDGSATVFTQGGLQPFSYLWCTNETTQTITGLTAGEYYFVTVIDSNNCSEIDNVLILICSDAVLDTVEQNVNVFPIPAQDMLFIESDQQINEIRIINIMGQTIYTEKKYLYFKSIDVSGFAEGLYFGLIKFENNTIRKKIQIGK